MRLRKLILHGFKSFADRTEFLFDYPVTGIVGPNGCGKSNVVDGFKWVLGEQSAKSLRGDAMMDVIFNGSSARKASGMAEVVLVFDNPKREDGTRHLNLDHDEVSVGRRLFRDGTSEYQVNNQAARLKDIRELFLDTGIGVDAYSVIEQGRVAQLLDSNPSERRLIFEEAAGISKFKAKKKEAQRKLERVDQNLLRVQDIVDEVTKRLRSVRIQAGRARTYQEHSQRLRDLRLNYALQEYYTLQTQLDEHVAGQGRLQGQLETISADLNDRQLALQASRQQFDEISQKKQKAEYELVQSRAALQSSRQRQDYAEQQLQQIADQLRQFAQDRETLTDKAADVEESLSREQESLARLTAELTDHRERIEEHQQQFHDTQIQLNQINREVEQHKAAILDLMRRSASLNNRLGAIEIERKNIAAQQQRLGQRRQTVLNEIEVLQAGRQELDEMIARVLADIAGLQAQLEESNHDAAALGRQIKETTEQLGAAREHRSGLVSRKRLLEDLEAKREGVSEGVKSVLRQRESKFPFIRGLVADVLRVDVEHATVIEAAIDGRDQMLVADDSAAVAAAAEELQDLEGRVNVLCTDRLKAEFAARQPVVVPALDQIELLTPPAGPAAHPFDGTVEILSVGVVSDAEQPVEAPAFADLAEVAVSQVCEEPAPAQCAPADLRLETAELPLIALELPITLETHVVHRDATQHSALSTQHSALPLRSALDYDWNLHPQLIRLAIDLVRFESADAALAHHLLGRTVIVDSLADARALHAAAPRGFRYVTQEGEVLEADGTLRAGPLTPAMSLISRRSELEALHTQIAEVDQRIEQLAQQLSTGNAQAKALQEKQNTLRNSIYQANTRKVETTSRIAQNTDKQSSFRRELPVLERELQSFLDQFGRLKTEETSLVEKRQAVDSEQSSRQQQIEQLVVKQAEGSELLKQCGEALTVLRVQLGQVQEKQIGSQQAVQRLTAMRNELNEQIERIARSAEQVASRRASVQGELAAAREAESELREREEKLSALIESLGGEVSTLQQSVQNLTAEVSEISAQHAQLSQSLHQLEMKIGEVRVRLEGLVQRTKDELELDLPARWAELQQQGGYQPTETDWNAVAEEIKQLKDKIHRLGNVNLEAIGEQDELETREQFLTAQVTDLTQSKKQLEELIETINIESADRFEKTFAAVREHFQGMFRKLFGGGKADILLETELETSAPAPVATDIPEGGPAEVSPAMKKIDILDAGIEIIAKPPGKHPCTISQLSGGEKTMTCIALLMSIFKSKPSPFCLLDEVDAALDEANNQRFNLIVQEFLDQSQFIVITHSKRTMQMVDILYGVTMQEQGVSKKVAVKFDQVDAQGQIREHAAA